MEYNELPEKVIVFSSHEMIYDDTAKVYDIHKPADFEEAFRIDPEAVLDELCKVH